jgi:hypothetical protein
LNTLTIFEGAQCTHLCTLSLYGVPASQRRKMLTISRIAQRITATSNWKLKGSLLTLLCTTAFLAFADVRASTPSPFTTVTPLSTKGFPFPMVCTPTNGSDVQFASGTWTIASGHSGYFLPAWVSGTFNVSSANNPSYTIAWYFNGSLWGSNTGYAQPNGLPTASSYAFNSPNYYWSVFYNRHNGPLTYLVIIEISTAPGQVACAQGASITASFVSS